MRARWWLLLVFAGSILALHANGRSFRNGETVPYRYLPVAILRDATFRLDAFPHLADQEKYYAVVRDREGHLISKKTVLPPLLMTPFFAAYRGWTGHWPADEEVLIFLGKLAMTVLAALAGAVLAAALLPAVRRRWIAWAAGFGLVVLTPFWFPANGGWPHAPLGLFNALSLYFLTARSGRGRKWAGIGLAQGLAVAGRFGCIPTAVVFLAAAACGGGDGRARLRRMLGFVLGALPPLLFWGAYNWTYFGHPLVTAFGSTRTNMIRWPFEGVAGLLMSPGEGLLLFSPILLLALLAGRRGVRGRFEVRLACAAFLAHLLYWGSYLDWWGGSAWGPRYLAEAIPFVAFLAAIGFDDALSAAAWRRRLIAAALALALFSGLVQAVGMFKWDNSYHPRFDPGFWVNEGNHWAWKAEYEPLWTLRTLPWQRPGWLPPPRR